MFQKNLIGNNLFRGLKSTIGCMILLLPFLDIYVMSTYKDVYVNSFFPHSARLWNYLLAECSSLTFDLNGFNSRVNSHHLYLDSF